MRVLGIDIGLVRTGVAISDESGIAIRLLPNLIAKTRREAIEKIIDIIQKLDVEAVVIGCPEVKTNASKTIASRAMGLKQALDEELKNSNYECITVLMEESYSSKKALNYLVQSGVPRGKRKSLLDAAAAAVMVEDFLRNKSF